MIVAGIDIGSVATKVVILKDGEVLATGLTSTGANPKLKAEEVLKETLCQVNLSKEELECIVSTGYGRRALESGCKVITEISACARGARWLRNPKGSTRTIIDLGGQDMKVISLEEDGEIVDFIMNDKCAAGTGRFLEVMASVLGVGLENLGGLSLESEAPIRINSTCTVFAESEVISLIAQGKDKKDIIAGIHLSIAERIVSLVRQLGEKETIFFCGGGAKNRGMHRALEDRLGVEVYIPQKPQFVIALGAALTAEEHRSSVVKSFQRR